MKFLSGLECFKEHHAYIWKFLNTRGKEFAEIFLIENIYSVTQNTTSMKIKVLSRNGNPFPTPSWRNMTFYRRDIECGRVHLISEEELTMLMLGCSSFL